MKTLSQARGNCNAPEVHSHPQIIHVGKTPSPMPIIAPGCDPTWLNDIGVHVIQLLIGKLGPKDRIVFDAGAMEGKYEIGDSTGSYIMWRLDDARSDDARVVEICELMGCRDVLDD
jgi:hypothetical protein